MQHCRKVIMFIMTVTVIWCYAQADCYAIKNSTLVTGTKKLFDDLMSAVLILAPVIGLAVFGFSKMKQMTAEDENDEKPFKNKSKSILITVVLIECAAGLIKAVLSYYQATPPK